MRAKRKWAESCRIKKTQDRYHQQFKQGKIKRFLDGLFRKNQPPMKFKAAIRMNHENWGEYTNDIENITQEVRKMVAEWIPPSEQAGRPWHLDTWAEEDLETVPNFVKEWILLHTPNREWVAEAYKDDQGRETWKQYKYDRELQQKINRKLHTQVAPGAGGVSQELWVYAPEMIRAREREIIQGILTYGIVPTYLKSKQLVLLPKTENMLDVIDL